MACSYKKHFITFPFLFLNASKSSGKTRLLKLLSSLIPRSKLTPNISEASLFRLPAQEQLNALLIDEAERMSVKEKATLRELLNQAYKRGGKVLRVEENEKKERIVKEYDVFLGVALANIWGLEPVLEDRCITIILEKSNNPLITKIPEYFELDERIDAMRSMLVVYEVHVGTLISNVEEYLFLHYLYTTIHTLPTLHTHITLPTLPTLPTEIDIEFVFKRLEESRLYGRDLEIWMPLLTMSYLIDKQFFEEIISLAEAKAKEKKEMDMMEDRDTIFSQFLHTYCQTLGDDEMIPLKKLRSQFFEEEGEKDWMSSEWIGRCLKRMGVIKNKRRLSKGLEVEIDKSRVLEYLKRRGIEPIEKEPPSSEPGTLDAFIGED